MTPRRRGTIKNRSTETGERYLIRVYKGRDENNKRIYVSKTIQGSKAKAKKALTRMLGRLDTQDLVVETDSTIRGYFTHWLNNRGDIAERTRQSWQKKFRLYVEPYLGDIKMKDLTWKTIESWQRELQGEQGLSPGTINMARALLSSGYNRAIHKGELTRNPTKTADNVLDKTRDEERVNVLTKKQARKLLEVAKEEEELYWPLWVIYVTTGLRPNEALGLKWKDLSKGNLSIQRAKSLQNREKGVLEFTSGKTFNAKRTIPLPPDAVKALQVQMITQIGWMKENPHYEDQGFMFTTKDGLPWLETQVRKAFKRLLEKAKLPIKTRIYDLRHTHATLLLASGVPLKVVSERLGHKDPALTIRTYIHVLPGLQKEASEKAQEVFFG